MFANFLKRVLRDVKLKLTYAEGDRLRIEVYWHETLIMDRTIDVMPNR